VGRRERPSERVDAHPRLKARLGEYYYAWVATFDIQLAATS